MLNAMSCWYFDWATAGTWVGGIGSALAALVALKVSYLTLQAQQKQKAAYLAGLTPQLIPEVAKVVKMAWDLEVAHGAHVYNATSIDYVKSGLSVPIANKLVEMGGLSSHNLALAAGELIASTKLITDDIEMVEKFGLADQLDALSQRVAKNSHFVYEKAITLAKALAQDYPSASDSLQVVFEMDENRRRLSQA